MDENIRDEQKSVYEVGYLIAGVPEEKVGSEAEAIKKIVSGAGAEVIAEEAPRHEKLAYTIHKKTVAGSYDKFDDAHFGWIKFEAGTGKIDGIKKAVETMPSVLRSLVITTIRENTYLGKHAPAVAESVIRKPFAAPAEAVIPVKKEAVAAPASIEDMDKSIDDMVKEV
jgi:ribosomal protein S6